MPRPREIGVGKVVGTKLSQTDAELLEALARREGVSVSKLVRRILLEYIHRALQSAPPDFKPEPPKPDPLDEMEWGDFLRAVDKLEREVDRYLELTRRFGARKEGEPLVLLSGGGRVEVYMPSVSKLFSRWNTLKRWYKSLKRREYEVSRRLVDIHEKIKEYGRLRGELPPNA